MDFQLSSFCWTKKHTRKQLEMDAEDRPTVAATGKSWYFHFTDEETDSENVSDLYKASVLNN